MKCPKCVEEGRTSRLVSEADYSTFERRAPEVFFTETGEYHHHRKNVLVSTWRCSNGHRVERSALDKLCWCEVNTEAADPVVTVIGAVSVQEAS